MLDNTAQEQGIFNPSWPPTPYTGLRPFQVAPDGDESLIFHGRDSDKDEILKRLNSSHLVFVIGPSGCGKSSLVKAGVIPALEAGLLTKAGHDWRSAEMRPQERPLRYLARALARLRSDGEENGLAAQIYKALLGDKNGLWLVAENLSPRESQAAPLLLLIDQFEEVFGSQVASQDEVKRFLECVIRFFEKPHPNLYCIVTMRTDFLGRCANFPQLADVINATLFVTPVLRAQELGNVIALPAEDYHAQIEPGLVKQIMSDMTADVQYDPDRLPLMQHAALWLWRRALAQAGLEDGPRPDQPPAAQAIEMKAEQYVASGGLKGILNSHAEQLFGSLSDRGKQIAEVLFRRLSERDAENRYRRAPATASEIRLLAKCSALELDQVVSVFANPNVAFLSCRPLADQDGDFLDVSHEALIRQWDRLRRWTDDEADKVRSFRDLARSAVRWESRDWSKQFFKKPVELRFWQNWWDRNTPTAEWIERYHLHRIGDRPLPELFPLTADYLRQNARHVRTKTAMIVGGIAAGIVLAWLATTAVTTHIHGQEVARLEQAKARVLAARGEESLDRDGATKALLIAVAGLRDLTYVPELERLAYKALQNLRERRIFSSERGSATSSFSPDGETLLVADKSEIRLWTVKEGRLLGATSIREFPAANRPRWSDNGAWIVAGSGDGRTVLFAPCSQEALRPLFGACRSEAGDAKTADVTRALRAGETSWPSTLSPDGNYLLSGGYGLAAKLWELRNTEPEYVKVQEGSGSLALAFHPQGNLLAVGASDGLVRIYEASKVTDAPLHKLDPRKKPVPTSCSTASQQAIQIPPPVTSIAFHPTKPELLATASHDGFVRVWNFETEQISCQRRIPSLGGIATATFSPTGDWIAVTSEDGPFVWNLHSNETRTLHGHRRSTRMVDFGSTDNSLASSSSESTRVWSMEPALQATSLGDRNIEAPLGAVETARRPLRIYNTRLNTYLDFTLPPHSLAAVSPDGAHVLTAHGNGDLKLYDSAVGAEPIAVLQAPSLEWKTVGFLANPDRVIAVSVTGAAYSWPYFKDRNALIEFASEQLPLVDGQRAELSRTERCRFGIKPASSAECREAFAQRATDG